MRDGGLAQGGLCGILLFGAVMPVFLADLYAMPVLWREQVLGWANLKVVDGRLQHELGFAGPRPRGSAFQRALDEALQQMQEFLEL